MPTKTKLQIRVASLDDATVLQRLINTTFNRQDSGPIALIDEAMPVVVIATKKGHYDKIVSNIQEIKHEKAFLSPLLHKAIRP